MKSIYTYKGATWIDLVKPTPEEISEVASMYALPGSVIAGLLSPSTSHVVELGAKHAYLVLHFPAFKDDNDGDAAFELDFVIGEDYLITARYANIEAFENFKPNFENTGLSKQPIDPMNVLFFGLFRSLISNFEHKLSKIDHWTRDIEKNMFSGKESRTIFEISEASRHLIDFRKITAVWPDAILTLEEEGRRKFGNEFGEYMHEIFTTFHKARMKMEMLAEAVRELRETNDSILSTKQNELMRSLTLYSVIIAGIVGVALVWLGYLAIR